MALRLQVVCDVCGEGHPRREMHQLTETLTARGEAAQDGWTYNEGGSTLSDLCPGCREGLHG